MRRSRLVIGVMLLMFGVVACESDDVGLACEDVGATPIGQEPVGGETPAVEDVRVTRDGTCESFMCIRHLGIAPYCSRECEIGTPQDPVAPTPCERDNQCSGEAANCAADGFCRPDDCPEGFVCRTLQPTGPLGGVNLCMRRSGCQTHSDCRNLGTIDCVSHGCYDNCLTLPSGEPCVSPDLLCEPMSALASHTTCSCTDGSPDLNCSDALLECRPLDSAVPWEPNAVQRIGICLPSEPAG